MIGLVAVIVLAALLVADVGRMTEARAALTTAADAAALAAAPLTFSSFGSSGSAREEASRAAAANGARLVRCVCGTDRSWSPRTVQVEVEMGIDLLLFGRRRIRAVAAAEFCPVDLGTG